MCEKTLTNNKKGTHRIEVKTGTVKNADTDAKVFITLYDGQIASSEFCLDNAENNFEIGKVDTFAVNLPFNRITEVRIRHDNSGKKPGWFLDYIKVTDNSCNKTYIFECNNWLSVKDYDGEIERILHVVNP